MGGRVAVLVSGSGTNLQALLDDPDVGPRIALVLSDRADAYGLARASAREVATAVLEPASFPDRAAHDAAVLAALEAGEVDVVVLAGYMRLLSKAALDAYPNRVVNVHPALLPAFPGTHGVADALAFGVKVTGVTVHLVDEGVDTGPIVLQEAVEVRRGDTWDTVEPRIHALEHRLLPRAVRALIEGRIVVDDRHAWIEGE
ncbi:MAG: phosphoribosylglycinamide formyltransferase [Actinomycetota bacterium]